MRPKRDYRSASKDNYLKFCEENPKIDIPFELFKRILYKWNDLFMTHILNTGERIKLPFGIGYITINKWKSRLHKKTKEGKTVVAYSVDWKKTKEEGKYVYHLNFHTGGYNYNWAWFPKQSSVKCSFIWSFKSARKHSRMLNTYLKKPNNIHKELYKEWVKYRK